MDDILQSLNTTKRRNPPKRRRARARSPSDSSGSESETNGRDRSPPRAKARHRITKDPVLRSRSVAGKVDESFANHAEHYAGWQAPQPTVLLTQNVDNHHMELNPNALKLINQGRPGVPVILVVIVGKARRGKSFLMNRAMLGADAAASGESMFQVSDSSNACTKGILIHGAPWPLRDLAERVGIASTDAAKLADVDVVFADTEGIDATDRTDGYDNNMLTFTCVASSAIMYNAHGPIDEDALAKIGMIAEVGKGLLEENGDDADRDTFPAFHWLARDFALVCHDGDGNEVSPDEYLEFQLADIPGASRKKNALRRTLRKCFATRMCHTFPRPVAEEDELRRVQDMSDDALRPQFMDALSAFRARLFRTLRAKTIGGHALAGPDLVDMMKRFVDAINAGAVPNVQDSWQQVAHARVKRAADAALATARALTASCSTNSGITIGELRAAHEKAFRQAIAAFRTQTHGLDTVAEERLLSVSLARDLAAAVDNWKTSDEGDAESAAARIRAAVTDPRDMLKNVVDKAQAESMDGENDNVVSLAIGETLAEWLLVAHKDLQLAARGRAAETDSSSSMAGADLPDEFRSALRATRAEELVQQDSVHAFAAFAPLLKDAISSLDLASSQDLRAAEEAQRYQAAIESLEREVKEAHEAAAQSAQAQLDAERKQKELEEEMASMTHTYESMRATAEASGAATTQAEELRRELDELRAEEVRRQEESGAALDALEERLRAQVQHALDDAAELRAERDAAVEELARYRENLQLKLAETESALESERRAGEMRERLMQGERVSLKEELQRTRALLLDAQTRFASKAEKREALLAETAETRLRWSEQLRTAEASCARSRAEADGYARELQYAREQLQLLQSTRTALEEARVQTTRLQSECDWLRAERKTLQEQTREQAKELAGARQDLREAKFASSVRLRARA